MRLRPHVRLLEAIEHLQTLIREVDTGLRNVHGPRAYEKFLAWIDRARADLVVSPGPNPC